MLPWVRGLSCSMLDMDVSIKLLFPMLEVEDLVEPFCWGDVLSRNVLTFQPLNASWSCRKACRKVDIAAIEALALYRSRVWPHGTDVSSLTLFRPESWFLQRWDDGPS